jgi:uncharacterized membrane protein (DUF4010 family)
MTKKSIIKLFTQPIKALYVIILVVIPAFSLLLIVSMNSSCRYLVFRYFWGKDLLFFSLIFSFYSLVKCIGTLSNRKEDKANRNLALTGLIILTILLLFIFT